MNKSGFNEQCVELESNSALIGTWGMESEHKLITKEDVLERAEALSLTSLLVHTVTSQCNPQNVWRSEGC